MATFPHGSLAFFFTLTTQPSRFLSGAGCCLLSDASCTVCRQHSESLGGSPSGVLSHGPLACPPRTACPRCRPGWRGRVAAIAQKHSNRPLRAMASQGLAPKWLLEKEDPLAKFVFDQTKVNNTTQFIELISCEFCFYNIAMSVQMLAFAFVIDNSVCCVKL